MYKLLVDLCLSYSPPMSEHARRIRLTRKMELPFPPYEGLAIFSREFDSAQEPPGFVLKNVTWDLDRQLFVAETFADNELAMAEIAEDLAWWLNLGWEWGSYMDHYRAADEDWDDDIEGDVESSTAEQAVSDVLMSVRVQL